MEEDHPTRVPFENWRNGDAAAFAQLFARFARPLAERVRRHRAWPMLARHCEVDDVVQQIWARAVPRLSASFELRGPGSLRAFLDKLADDEVIDLARRQMAGKRGRGGPKSLDTGFDAPDVGGPSRSAPETPTGHARSSEIHDLAATLLSEREFRAWELVELRGHTAEEAARIMGGGNTDSSVRGLVFRAKAKVIAAMRPDEDRPPNDPDAARGSGG